MTRCLTPFPGGPMTGCLTPFRGAFRVLPGGVRYLVGLVALDSDPTTPGDIANPDSALLLNPRPFAPDVTDGRLVGRAWRAAGEGGRRVVLDHELDALGGLPSVKFCHQGEREVDARSDPAAGDAVAVTNHTRLDRRRA